MNKKFFAVSILACLFAFGCSDDAKKKDAPAPAAAECNNGVLEGGEICDGDQFAEGKRVCPTGYTVDDVSKITCTDSCALDTTACVPENSNCGNSALDEGEVCDGELFAEGQRVCPNGYSVDDVSKITCTASCALDTTACVADNPEDKCGNGELDEGEDCDGELFAEGKRECPTDFTVDDVNKIKCTSACVIDSSACTEKCVENTQMCDGNVYKVCVQQTWLDEDCSKTHKTCSETNGCVIEYKASCNNNVLHMCEGEGENEECIDQDCTELASVCDAENADCVPTAFTCDGSKVKITGTELEYDCANNRNKTGLARDSQFCNSVYGCSDVVCIGDNLTVMVCNTDDCDTLDEACDPGMCSDKIQACKECADGAVQCTGDVAKVCVDGKWKTEDCDAKYWKCDEAQGGCYNPDPCPTEDESKCDGEVYKLCINNTWVTDDCGADEWRKCDATNGCVSKTSVCGNGNKEAGEACDGDQVYKTCADFDRNYKWEGKPACNDTCSKVVTGTCVHKAEVEIDSWTITNLATMKNNGRIDLKGGMTTSKPTEEGGWIVGPWGTASSPAFDDRYVSFISNVNDSSKYDTLIFNFTVKRNSVGPQKLKVAFYDGDTKIYESEEVSVKITDTDVNIRKVDPNASGKISVRVSGYGSANGSGTMTLSKMKLLGTNK